MSLEALLPQPRYATATGESVELRSPLCIAAPSTMAGVVNRFARDLKQAVGWDVEHVTDAEFADIEIVTAPELRDEAFSLAVDGRVQIGASSEAGLAYAFIALRQLGPVELFATAASLDTWSLPGVSLFDEPSYGWRGAHLDVSRHFWDVATVLRFIDLLHLHRLNRLHLHLNDDQGWRIEVPAWPGLTSIGAWRASSPVGHESEGRQDGVPHGGFYSVADIETLRAHAAERHVTLIPEIDLPGHAQAVLAAYPAFGNTSEPVETWTHWGISERVLNVEDRTLDFADDVVQFVAGLFPGSPVHIGGDECPTDEWAASARARQVMHEHGFHDPRQLQGLYTNRLAQGLQASGHEVVAWDEVLDADVPDGTIIAAWRHSDKGVEAAQRGFDVVMAPEQFVYLDVLNSDHPDEPVAISPLPRVTSWQDVYGFRVLPENLAPELHHHVRGAQAQLWTEYIATRDHLDYMAFPRLCAFSEVVWGTATTTASFAPRLAHHTERLRAAGVAFRPLDSLE